MGSSPTPGTCTPFPVVDAPTPVRRNRKLVDVTPVLGLEAGITAWVLLGGTAAVILVFLVFNPWRAIRDEPRIPEEAETRLLLRQDFDTIDEEMGTKPVDEDTGAYWESKDSLSQIDVGEGDE